MNCLTHLAFQQQQSQSTEFCKQNADAISQLNDKIIAAGARFLASFQGRVLLPAPVFESAQNAISAKSVDGLVGILRPFAANFSYPFSGVYWSLIDAANFLSDATGIRWPYMTQERRQSALKFAFEDIESFEQSLTHDF